MWQWIKKHLSVIVTILVTVGFLFYCYGCEPKVESLDSKGRMVNRQELQFELDHIINTAQIRMADLERQVRIRALILQNALMVVQGQPFNPVGLVTGVASIYGISQASSNIGKTVKNVRNKRKVNNGTA